MNYTNIIKQLADTDPEFFDRTSERRSVIKNWSRKVALAAVPFALGSLFNKAYGKDTDQIIDTLNFALNLELLESTFYNMMIDGGTNQSALFNTAARQAYIPGFQRIKQDENQHVADLQTTITSLGGTPATADNYDFKAGGTYPDVFTNFDTFAAVSQAFEDTGVRAYKGGAPSLMSNNDVLTAALNIHSVEARHASYIRRLRGERPWIQSNSTTVPNAAAVYEGEDNIMQSGLNIRTNGGQNLTQNEASAAFDEPLTVAQVTSIVTPFGVTF